MDAVRAGKRLSQSHKEGDTRFVCSHDQRARIDEGENQGHQTFRRRRGVPRRDREPLLLAGDALDPDAEQQFVWSPIARMVRE